MPGDREVKITFLGDAAQLNRTFDQVGQQSQTMGQRMAGVGDTLTRRLTPAAAAFGAASGLAFRDFDAGVDALRAGTGASGEALDELTESMKDVGGRVTDSMGEVGQVMADLNTRTGATGEQLETMTQRVLELNGRLGNTASVENVTRLFGDWSVATEDQVDMLDRLFRASQSSGGTIDDLSAKLVQFGAPLRNLGFDLDEATALIASFERAGVNLETVMGGLRQGIGRVARAGEDVPETFRRIVTEIENAGSSSEATAIAIEAFGQRAGPDLADAIQNGQFAVEEMLVAIQDGEDTIAQAAADTLSWSDRLGMLKNRVVGVVGPFGEMGIALAGIAAGIGPVLSGLGRMGGVFSRMGRGIGGAVGGIGRFATAIGPAGIVAGLGIATAAFVGINEQMRFNRQVSQENKIAADQLAEAMRAQGGAVGEATQAWIQNRLTIEDESGIGREVIATMAELGLTMEDLEAALSGGEDTTKAFVDRLTSANPQLDRMGLASGVLEGGMLRMAGAFRNAEQDAANLDAVLGGTTSQSNELGDSLTRLSGDFTANVTADTTAANAELDALWNRLDGFGRFRVSVGGGPIPYFQHGGVLSARPGGWLVNVAEAGEAEAIVPLGRSATARRDRHRVLSQMMQMLGVPGLQSGGIAGTAGAFAQVAPVSIVQNVQARDLPADEVLNIANRTLAWQLTLLGRRP